MGAVDMIHPDLATSGGILETKKIGDYAMEHGVPMAMHFAGSPISFMANVHCAAATENFVALEHHSLDVPWWGDLVTPTPVIEKGFAVVPDRPGLGVEPNPEVIKAHLEGARLLRAHPGVGQGALLGPALELTDGARGSAGVAGLPPGPGRRRDAPVAERCLARIGRSIARPASGGTLR